MKNALTSIMAMAYLFLLAVTVITGAFIYMGLPFNDRVALIPFIGVGVLTFERLCKLCKVF